MKPVSINLILRSLKEELLPNEQEELNNWLKESPLHREYYKQIKSSNLNIEENRQVYIQKINSLRLKRISRLAISISSIAACAIIAIGIYLSFPDKSINNYQMLTQIVQVSSKAYIINEQTGKKEELKDSIKSFSHNYINSSIPSRIYPTQNKDIKEDIHLESIAPNQITSISTQTIYIPKGGEYSIILPDNSLVKISPNSKLQFAESFVNSKSREVYLEGEAFFNVSKDSKPFIVRTKTSKVQVYGTSFYVEAYENDPLITTVHTGKVSVKELGSNNEVFLTANQQAILDHGIKVNTVDSSIIEAWNNGLFAFDDAPLEDVVKKIERWYNVKIDFETPELKETKITCRISKNHNLSHVFKMINHAVNMNFKINNNTITLFK